MFFEYYLYYLYYTFLGFPFIIRVAVCAICFYTPIILAIFYFLFHTRNRFYNTQKLEKKLKEKYFDKMKVLTESPKDYIADDIVNDLGNPKKLSKKEKRILTDFVFNINKESVYVNQNNYRKIVDCFELPQFWERKLQYGSFTAKHHALRRLDDLDTEIPGSVITAFTYNRNQYLRKMARVSFMHYSKNSPYKFFEEDFDKTFNKWDRVEIHRALNLRSAEGLPNFTQWIKNSQNVEFKCFLIDEIRIFKQQECCPFLLGVLEDSEIKLRQHAIEALGEMKYADAEQQFIKSYALQPEIIQHSIVNAIQKINSGNATTFLEEAYYSAHSSDSEIFIARAIYNYGEKGRQLFHKLESEAHGFSKLVFEHVSNPLIKYN